MCKFFPFVSDPNKPIPDRFMYFNSEIRDKILNKELNYELDSHTSIAYYFKYDGVKEDRLNKYEYNPLTEFFTIDQINNRINDSQEAEIWVRGLDFKTIVPQLRIKPILYPFSLIPPEVSSEVQELLKQWASVFAGIGVSVADSVWGCVGYRVGYRVWDTVRASVWASLRAGVGVRIADHIWDSSWGYISSFFDIEYPYDYSPLIRLWEMGLVPSFDGQTWRLHGGEKADILFETKGGFHV